MANDMKRIIGVLLAAAFGTLVTLTLTGNLFGDKKSVIRVEHSDNLPVKSARYTEDGALLDFTVAAERTMPAVVHIKSTQVRSRRGGNTPSQLPDLFREFFGPDMEGQRPSQPRPSVGSGSGVILTEDGYIVTNNHVVKGADDIEVVLNDNRSFKAEVVGLDPMTDLAVIKVDQEGLTSVAVGNSDKVKVGEWVLAVGNPFRLNSTATAGIVSAKGRNINILRDRAAIESFIQTDAAINPGNSGGALVNLQGELIGINTAIASPTGAYAGYAFAVPSNLMRKVVRDLMEHGSVQRGYLGVSIRNVDASLARSEDLDVTEGVYVAEVVGDGAADESGIERGDVILSVNGRAVKSAPELQAAIGMRRPGDEVMLLIDRDGRRKEMEVTLKDLKGNAQLASNSTGSVQQMLGVQLEAVEGGVKIAQLMRGKLSRETDIREGFIIKRINDQRVKTVEEVEKLLAERQGGVMLEGEYENYDGTYYYAFGM